jgi:hypothetical protein
MNNRWTTSSQLTSYCCQRSIRDVTTLIKRHSWPRDWLTLYLRLTMFPSFRKPTACSDPVLRPSFSVSQNMLSTLHEYISLCLQSKATQRVPQAASKQCSLPLRNDKTARSIFFLMSTNYKTFHWPLFNARVHQLLSFSVAASPYITPFLEFDYKQTQNSITPHVRVKWDHSVHRYCLNQWTIFYAKSWADPSGRAV